MTALSSEQGGGFMKVIGAKGRFTFTVMAAICLIIGCSAFSQVPTGREAKARMDTNGNAAENAPCKSAHDLDVARGALLTWFDVGDAELKASAENLRERTRGLPRALRPKIEKAIFSLYDSGIEVWWKLRTADLSQYTDVEAGLRHLGEYAWCLYTNTKDPRIRRKFEADWAKLVEEDAAGSIRLLGSVLSVGSDTGATSACVPSGLLNRAKRDPVLLVLVVLPAIEGLGPLTEKRMLRDLEASPEISGKDIKQTIAWKISEIGQPAWARPERVPSYYKGLVHRMLKEGRKREKLALERYKVNGIPVTR